MKKILYLLPLLLYTFTLSQEAKENLKGIDEEINAYYKKTKINKKSAELSSADFPF